MSGGQVCNGDAESSGSPLKPKIAKLNPDDATSKSFLTKVHDLVGFVVVELIIAVAGVLKMLLMTRDSNSPFKGPNLGNKKTVLTASRMELKVCVFQESRQGPCISSTARVVLPRPEYSVTAVVIVPRP